jgi:hypothetical protein
MAAKTETCPNKECPFRSLEDNKEGVPFTRDYIEVSDRLCPYCESRLKPDK